MNKNKEIDQKELNKLNFAKVICWAIVNKKAEIIVTK
jgi:hypothetical protein